MKTIRGHDGRRRSAVMPGSGPSQQRTRIMDHVQVEVHGQGILQECFQMFALLLGDLARKARRGQSVQFLEKPLGHAA